MNLFWEINSKIINSVKVKDYYKVQRSVRSDRSKWRKGVMGFFLLG